mmetsp:Transcript_12127/g.31082  ORF Transcript_12127/g.31082 Transcript_12127/m.31082 type:complete len:279 (-) Transcript_12127:326-1162(-)
MSPPRPWTPLWTMPTPPRRALRRSPAHGRPACPRPRWRTQSTGPWPDPGWARCRFRLQISSLLRRTCSRTSTSRTRPHAPPRQHHPATPLVALTSFRRLGATTRLAPPSPTPLVARRRSRVGHPPTCLAATRRPACPGRGPAPQWATPLAHLRRQPPPAAPADPISTRPASRPPPRSPRPAPTPLAARRPTCLAHWPPTPLSARRSQRLRRTLSAWRPRRPAPPHPPTPSPWRAAALARRPPHRPSRPSHCTRCRCGRPPIRRHRPTRSRRRVCSRAC